MMGEVSAIVSQKVARDASQFANYDGVPVKLISGRALPLLGRKALLKVSSSKVDKYLRILSSIASLLKPYAMILRVADFGSSKQ